MLELNSEVFVIAFVGESIKSLFFLNSSLTPSQGQRGVPLHVIYALEIDPFH